MHIIIRILSIATVSVMLVFTSIIGVQAQERRELLPPPTNITLDLFEGNSVIILWDGVEIDGLSGYIVSRTDNPDTSPLEIARVEVGVTSYIDSTVQVGNSYTYRVSSFADGYINGDSELITVLVQQTIANVETDSEPGNTGIIVPGLNIENIQNRGRQFWINLVAFNLVCLGIGICMYLLIRNWINSGEEMVVSVQHIPRKNPIVNNLKVKIKPGFRSA